MDKACRNGRTFEDFKKYCKEHPSLPVVQIDSVEGVKGGAVLPTVHFVLPRPAASLSSARQMILVR